MVNFALEYGKNLKVAKKIKRCKAGIEKKSHLCHFSSTANVFNKCFVMLCCLNFAWAAQREIGRQKAFPITPIELLVIAKYGSLWTKWIYFGWYNSAELLEIEFQRFLFQHRFLILWILCTKNLHFHCAARQRSRYSTVI